MKKRFLIDRIPVQTKMVDNEVIAMMMRLEGIVLDTCYAGKAFAGLVRRASCSCILAAQEDCLRRSGMNKRI